MGVVLLLICIKAFSAEFDSGPNESDHYPVARFYAENALPVPVGTQTTLLTYSRYGYSYIDTLNVSYLISGRWLKFADTIGIPSFFSIRTFNVILAAGLVILLVCFYRYYPTLLLLLVTPDFWYHFSYFNGDAFSMVVAVSLILLFYRLLAKVRAGCNIHQSIWNTVFCGILGGLMVVVKINFTLVALFLALWSAIQFFSFSGSRRIEWTKVCLLAGIIGLVVAAPRVGYDVYLNGLDKKNKVEEMRIQLAAPAYLPENLEKSGAWSGLNLSSKDVSIKEVVVDNDWLWLNFRKAAGMFGYHHWYYLHGVNQALAALILLLIILYLMNCCKQSQNRYQLFSVALAGGFFVFNILVSLYHTMTLDFQPEFRYLIPSCCILLMPGLEVKHVWKGWAVLVVKVALVLSFMTFFVACIIAMPKTQDYQIKRDSRYFEYTNPKLRESKEEFLRRRGLGDLEVK